ncbi:CD63 antigen-like [Anoplophora glabripennis]|uniref:CD63 antigen-like n=1 Tax=Anoplophora glabripennis TaxID=217634 RepID=UPI000874EFF0|nr:CD63 antigen-like [Anoplophora glabripennis]
MKGLGLNLIKYVLFIFNLIFAVSGIGLIIAGSLVLSDVGEFNHFMEGKILAPPVVLIVAGVIVFLVASLGCYGAIKESYYMLMAFAICLLIIFIIEFAVGIAAASFKSEFRVALKNNMKNSMDNYENSKSDKIAWDNLQRKLECCGVDGPTDWKKRPMSCCHALRENAPDPTSDQCRAAQPGDDHLYNYGCFTELEMKAERASKVLIGVGIGVAFIEIIGIILACWMASAVKNKE